MGAKTAPFAIEQVYNRSLSEGVDGNGLVGADQLADLAPLAHMKGETSLGLAPGLFMRHGTRERIAFRGRSVVYESILFRKGTGRSLSHPKASPKIARAQVIPPAMA